MKPFKHMLIQTAVDWICESGLTPFVKVKLEDGHASLPESHHQADSNYAQLNISARACPSVVINEARWC
ncbi:hypothetical protein [Parendozoicomonas sp. Alg238-R29]|uniref:hypothetical protein n=1 Tax=Parendozoicomonas sp. Alg238-R29 TaxID=2993446 RepID=UPI00248DAF6F|nr:hypothetical protein [Parendozoicomonas sp. Alg238-R29]